MLSRQQRWRKRPNRKFKIILYISIAVLVISMLLYYFLYTSIAVTAGAPANQNMRMTSLSPYWKEVLTWGIPGLTGGSENSAVKVKKQFDFQSFVHSTILLCTNIDMQDIRSLLQIEIPVIAKYRQKAVNVTAGNVPKFPKLTPIIYGNKPIVGIYHTHTAESFVATSGVTHKPGGQRGDIVDIGETLAQRLENYGISSIHSKNIHDYPSFMKAYGLSETTVKQLLTDNPSIQMVFDIHRDAGKRDEVTATVNGLSMARITIVVATGQPDLIQPHWQENHAFAKLIDAKLNQHFPGLSRGIQLVDWRYNQHLHPRALLLEFGCQDSTKEEAIRSIELFGDVVAEIIAESK